MRRLASLVGVEVKTERSDAQNGRHLSTIPHATWIAWKYFFAESSEGRGIRSTGPLAIIFDVV
jgi:hypothetical protein